MDEQFDFVIIGGGPAGEAAAYKARSRGATVAVVDRELFGGSCPFWACMPSKTLLHAAAIHAGGGDYDWARASARRDYMISREGTDFPSDAGHVAGLEAAGAVAMRGTARIAGPGRVLVTHDGVEHELHARHIVVAVGSTSKVPVIEGIDTITPWTNREATSTRQLRRADRAGRLAAARQSEGPSAKLRGARGDASRGWRGDPDRRARGPGTG